MGGLRHISGTEQEEQAWDQEAFARVYRHLMRQGERSCRKTPRDLLIPAYYGRDGRRCPVGCLIPPEEYHESLEELRLEQIQTSCPSLHPMDLNLLWALRACHDELTPPRWKKRLSLIAGEFRLLVTPELDRMRLNEGMIEYYGVGA